MTLYSVVNTRKKYVENKTDFFPIKFPFPLTTKKIKENNKIYKNNNKKQQITKITLKSTPLRFDKLNNKKLKIKIIKISKKTLNGKMRFNVFKRILP